MRAFLALAAVLAAAGCGTPAPSLRGSTLVLDHQDSSVPPPYHRDWRIEVRPDGAGSIRYWPGYAGAVTPLDRSFTVPPDRQEALLQAMEAAGVTSRHWAEGLPMPGGSSNRIEVRGAGSALVLPGALPPADSQRLAPVAAAFAACVPDDVWAELRGT